jgi:hypothetical protein
MKVFNTIYLTLIGIAIGAIIVTGIVVAPIMFHTENILGSEILSNFQEGLVQSEIFVRFNYILLSVTLIVAIVETYYFVKKRDFIMYLLALVSIISSFLFVFYFTTEILNFNKLGEASTKTAEFKSIHKSSVMDFKVMLLSFILLVGYKGYKINKD